MPHVFRALVAGVTAGLMSLPAAASIGFAIDSNGSIYSIDTSNPASTTFVVNTALFSSDGLARHPGTGRLWGINWSGNLVEIDPVAETSINRGLVTRPGGSGFYKDLAWDPVHNRLLATHLGSAGAGVVNRIVQIDTATAQHTVLAELTGLQGNGPQILGFGVSVDGAGAVYNFGDGWVYDLGPIPLTPVGTLAATRRAVRSFNSPLDMRGMEFDHATGQLFSSGQGLYEIAPSGAATLRTGFGSPQFRDLTFIPAPTAAGLMGLACVWTLRRRR